MQRYAHLDNKPPEFLIANGLVPQTAEEVAEEHRLFSSARPFSTIWKDKDNQAKLLAWDSDFEKYLAHRTKLIKLGGVEEYAPWNIYEAAGYKWSNGFALPQGRAGTCQVYGTKVLTNEGLVPGNELIGRDDIKFFSFDTEAEDIVMRDGFAYDCGEQECVRITVQVGAGGKNPIKTVTFTHGAEHPVMRTDGRMVNAAELQPGMSVVTTSVSVDPAGYAAVHPNTKAGKVSGRQKRFNKIISPTGCLHHIDRNRLNNKWSNLVIGLTNSEHRKLHSDDPSSLRNKEAHAKTVASAQQNYKNRMLERFYVVINEIGTDEKAAVLEAWVKDEVFEDIYISCKRGGWHSSAAAERQKRKTRVLREMERRFGSYEALQEEARSRNGRVISVENIGRHCCFDIEICHPDPDDGRDWTQHNYYQGDENSEQYCGSLLCVKNCAGAALRNSLMCSDLVNCKFTDQKPVETGVDIVYALSRGNGRLAWGNGCNGTPLVKYATEIGHYWTSDIGPYTTGGSNVTSANMNNPQYKAHALSRQSICIYLPAVDFDLFAKVCAAGLSIWIGSPAYPGSAKKGASGLSEVASFSRGAHATTFTYSVNISGSPLLFFQNSHGNGYASFEDALNSPRSGTWVNRSNFSKFGITKSYGTPFVNLGELPEL